MSECYGDSTNVQNVKKKIKWMWTNLAAGKKFLFEHYHIKKDTKKKGDKKWMRQIPADTGIWKTAWNLVKLYVSQPYKDSDRNILKTSVSNKKQIMITQEENRIHSGVGSETKTYNKRDLLENTTSKEWQKIKEVCVVLKINLIETWNKVRFRTILDNWKCIFDLL